MESDNRNYNPRSSRNVKTLGFKCGNDGERFSHYGDLQSQSSIKTRSSSNQKSSPGWRYGSNEELNRSESETDEYDNSETAELTDDARFSGGTASYGWNLAQESSELDGEKPYKQNARTNEYYSTDRNLRHIPEFAEYHPSGNVLNKTNIRDLNKRDYSLNKNVISPKRDKYQEGKFSQHLDYRIFIIIPFLMYIAYYFMFINSEILSNEHQLRNEIINIRSEFPSQKTDIWYKFSSGIKDVEGDPSHPSVFLILYDREEDTPICLAVKIAKAAMNFLNATKSGPIILDGVELGKNKTLMVDYGELVDEEKHKVEEHRTMIVKNLHKVPGKIAQSFHSLCDIYTPLVDKAVYLFTLQAAGASSVDYPTELAEKELERRWKKELSEDKLKPLITRITDTVIAVKSEQNLASSCANVKS